MRIIAAALLALSALPACAEPGDTDRFASAGKVIAAPRALAIAARHVGKSGPALGLPARLWCMDFVNFVLRQTGGPTVPSRLARDAVRLGPRVRDPRPGDVAVLRRGRDGVSGHVGFVERVLPDGSFVLLEGNGAGRRVSRSLRDRSRLIAFVRPAARHASL